MKRFFHTPGWDHLALLIVLAPLIWANIYLKFWTEQRYIIAHDVVFYYQYLPAAIIHHDLSLKFTKENPELHGSRFWGRKTKVGKSVNKMTMGLSVLHTPFFLAAHALAGPLGYEPDGFTEPYRVALIVSSITYVMLGLWLLLILLRRYFARGAVALTILALGLGTNLFFYTTIAPAMSHAYSFFLFAAFLLAVDTWATKPSVASSIMVGLIGGLIALVRPTNAIVFLLLPLWQVGSFTDLGQRVRTFLTQPVNTVLIVLFACLAFAPQVIYWKYVTGDFFYYSYGEEGFFFHHPVFLKGLFSYRKGWLIYTPVMIFALLGIIVLYFRNRRFFWALAVFTALNLYIVWSWWCWWYGGGFGQRALIESYAILAFPLTAFTQWISEKRWVFRTSYIVLIFLLMGLNLFQVQQYRSGLIHYDAMSKEAYWNSYRHLKFPPGFDDTLDPPDYKAALKGDR